MEKFNIKNRKGLRIVGEIHKPVNSVGLAFTVHGLGAFKEHPSIMTAVNILLENNFNVVNFDTTNSLGESEGKYEDATMQQHYNDLVDVINWSKTQEWYSEPFTLAGSSFGGYAVLRYAEDYPQNVKGVFSKAGVVSGKLSFERSKKFNTEKYLNWQNTGWYEEESFSKPGVIKRLPWSHIEERLNHDLLPKVSKLTMPILIIVGDQDISHLEDQRTLFDVLPENSNNQLHIMKDAPHTFREEKHLNEMKDILDNWLKKIK